MPESATTRDYDTLYRRFRWAIPARYNIGVDVCDRWAAHDPGRLAILHVRPTARSDSISYGWLRETSNRLANVLRAHGVARGDRVAIFMPQAPEVAAAHVAIYKLGAVALPIAMLFGPDALVLSAAEFRRQGAAHQRAGARQARGDPRRKCRRCELRDFGRWRRRFADFTGARRVVRFHRRRYLRRRPGDDDLHLRHHRPAEGRAACPSRAARPSARRRDAALFRSRSTATATGRRRTGPGPAACSMCFCRASITACRWWRASFDKFDPEEAFALMATEGVRNAFIPPTALRMMRAVPSPRGRYDFNLRSMASGGESLGIEALEWGRAAFGLTINEFYGQTECNLVLGSCAQLGMFKAGAIGKPVPGHTVAVIERRRRTAQSRRGRPDRGQAPGPGDVPGILGQGRRPRATSSSATGW